jgi:anaerobic glycerol-3-phosphate dehydrogenase
MATQDDVVAAFETIITTSADVIKADVLSYHQSLGTILFQIPELDNAHKEEVRAVDKSQLISLRYRLESLLTTLLTALQAGNF